jgi:hypothetical protein
VVDNGWDTAGSYSLSLLNITGGPLENGNDTDGSAIVSNQIVTGTFQQGVDMDAFTFSVATPGRLFLAAVAGGVPQDTYMYVYPPGGGASLATTNADVFDVHLPQTGLYTIVIEDLGNDHTGTYTLSVVDVTSGPFSGVGDTGGQTYSNDITAGGMSGVCDIDAYRFFGSNNDRVRISAVATSGGGFNTYIYLYPPNGAAALTYTGGDQLDVKLNASGFWTAVVLDNAADTPGNYSFSYLNLVVGPFTGGAETDGGALLAGTPRNGSASGVADMDGYTFFGVTGQTATLNATTTSGTMDTYMVLYGPAGAAAVLATNADNVVQPISVNGVYTLVVEDLGQTDTGTYTVSLSLTSPPTGVGDAPPAQLALLPGSPSPFTHATRFGVEMPEDGRAVLRVYDVTGRLVRTLVDGERTAGRFDAAWDGRDGRGIPVASGVYYVQLRAGGEVRRQKIVLVR